MRLPRRISEVLKKRDEFIERGDARISKYIRKMQSTLITHLTSEIIPKLNVVEGRTTNSLNNYRLLTHLNKVYNDFNRGQRIPFANEVTTILDGITKLNIGYFEVTMGLEQSAMFEAIAAETTKKLMLRVGLDGGKIVAGGFLDTLVNNETLLLEIKNFTAQAVTGQVKTKDFIKGLNVLVTGDEGAGGIERQFNRYAHDVFMQYDAAYSTSVADKLQMNYFVYQGDIMKSTRDFCAAHAGKVIHKDEAEKWRDWTPAKGVYPAGYEIKQKNHNAVPSYLSYEGYEPLIDRGGYNCRHSLGWLPDSIAEKRLNK